MKHRAVTVGVTVLELAAFGGALAEFSANSTYEQYDHKVSLCNMNNQGCPSSKELTDLKSSGDSKKTLGFIGYGVGITSGSQTISDAGRYSETSTARGVDYARLSGGLQFRPTRGFGLGPFAVASIGRYTHQRTEINGVVTYSGDLPDRAFHAWLMLGLRMVIFP